MRPELRGCLAAAALAAIWGGCAPPGEDRGRVARGAFGEVRGIELDAYLLGLPEGQRQAPASEPARSWRRRQLETLLAEKALLQEAAAGAADAGREERERRWQRRHDDLLAARLAAGIAAAPVAEAELREYYEAHPAEFSRRPSYVLRHIFKKLPAGAGEAAKRAAAAALEGYAREARQGVFFDELARRHSDSETAARGGSLGAIPEGKLGPRIDALLAGLPEGGLSEPVETPLGYHLFQLEKKVWLAGRSFAEVRKELLERFTLRRRREQEERLFRRLLAESGARYRPEALDLAFADPAAELFSLGGSRRFTLGDFAERWRRSSFAEQRERSPEARLRQEVLPMLLAAEAERLGLDREPQMAAELAAQRRAFDIEGAREARVRAWRQGLPEAELRRLFEARRASWQSPRLHRLRLLVLAVAPGEPPAQAAQRAERLAAAIGRGERSFEDAARELSVDPSRAAGGDLGFLPLTEVWPWLGAETRPALAALAPGQLSAPLPLRRRDGEKGQVELYGLALFQLAEIAEPREPSFAEARERLAAELERQRAGELDEVLRRDLLAVQDARIFEENL